MLTRENPYDDNHNKRKGNCANPRKSERRNEGKSVPTLED